MSTTPRRDPIDLTVIGGFVRRRQDDAAQRAPARHRAITARGDARAADGTGDRLSHPHKSGLKLVRRAHLDCAAAADWTCASPAKRKRNVLLLLRMRRQLVALPDRSRALPVLRRGHR